jgi:hypothetical protein
MTISRTTRNVHSFPGLPTEGLPGFACFVGEATHPGKAYPSVDSLGTVLKNLAGARHPPSEAASVKVVVASVENNFMRREAMVFLQPVVVG